MDSRFEPPLNAWAATMKEISYSDWCNTMTGLGADPEKTREYEELIKKDQLRVTVDGKRHLPTKVQMTEGMWKLVPEKVPIPGTGEVAS